MVNANGPSLRRPHGRRSASEPFHADPADRLLVATARALPATLITRDAKILSYSKAGHVRALAC
jgi:PIN domain nuclease of toxin-antitoxin system